MLRIFFQGGQLRLQSVLAEAAASKKTFARLDALEAAGLHAEVQGAHFSCSGSSPGILEGS